MGSPLTEMGKAMGEVGLVGEDTEPSSEHINCEICIKTQVKVLIRRRIYEVRAQIKGLGQKNKFGSHHSSRLY